MLINYVPGEESRIAIVRDGRLEEFYQERASAESHVGNIYQGKVMNVEPSIQAAFIDFGLERNGFLHISDVHPKYFPGKDREEFEQVGSKTPHRERPPIQRCLRRGDVVLVQVLKEGIGTKGPTLTSYLSIPGRFLVMMPDMQRTGVSRKVEDDDARREMRKILDELNPPKDFGFIIRTAGIGQTKTELKRDLSYLQRLWKNLDRRRKGLKGPGELYTESDLIIRTIRDVFTSDVDRVVVDDVTAARRAHDFLTVASPRSRSKVVYYNGPVPLYHQFDIESQIESIHARTVPLPSGGSLVIDQTEALVAIDVNSGKSREARDAESNAYNTNLEAVDEICRQLRLRDMGGVVVNDLIDMRSPKHRKAVETRMRDNLKRDRARTRLGTISTFGILEMTRQRMRGSLKSSLFTHCAACAGSGHIKTAESVVLDVMRRLALAMHHNGVARIELTISPDVAFHLLNRKRHALVELEDKFQKPVMVRVGGTTMDFVEISAFDARGSAVEPASLSSAGDDDEANDYFVEMTGAPIDLEIEEDEPVAEAEDESDNADRDVSATRGASGDEEEGDTDRPAGGPPRGEGEPAGEDGEGKRRRRRRRGGRRRRRKGDAAMDEAANGDQAESGRDEGHERGGPGEPGEPAQVSEAGAVEEPERIEAEVREASPMAAGKPPAMGSDADDHSDAAEDAAEAAEEAAAADDDTTQTSGGENGEGQGTGEGGRKRRRRRRRRGRGSQGGQGGNGGGNGDPSEGHTDAAGDREPMPAPSVSERHPEPEPAPVSPPVPTLRPAPTPRPRGKAPAPRAPKPQPPATPRTPASGSEAPPPQARPPRPVSSGYSNRIAPAAREQPSPGNVKEPKARGPLFDGANRGTDAGDDS